MGNQSVIKYISNSTVVLILSMSALSGLILISLPEQKGQSESEWTRQMWFIAILYQILSINIKSFMLYILKWGKIKECISSCLKAYAGSLMLLLGFFTLIIIDELITSHELQGINIREYLGGILWWQTAGFFLWIPLSILVEGGILQYL